MRLDDEVVEFALRMGGCVVEAQVCLYEMHQAGLILGCRSTLGLQALQELGKDVIATILECDVLVRPGKFERYVRYEAHCYRVVRKRLIVREQLAYEGQRT